jgi:hypothetical protein
LAARSKCFNDCLGLNLSSIGIAVVEEVDVDGHALAGGAEYFYYWRIDFLAFWAFIESVSAHIQDHLTTILAQTLDVEAVVLQALHLHHWDFVALVE